MTNAVAAPTSRKGLAAFVYDDIGKITDWRERLHWPIAHVDIANIGHLVPAAVISAAASFSDLFERQVATVAGPLLGGGFMSLLEAAWVSQEAKRLGLEIVGGPPEMALLAHGREDFAVQEYRGFRVMPVPHSRLRRMVRMAMWTPVHRLPRALLTPEAVAVTYNSLLVQATKGHAVGFHHAPNMVAQSRGGRSRKMNIDVVSIADKVLDRLLPLAPILNAIHRDRLRRVFNARIKTALTRVVEDIAALREYKLPNEIWSGTNGFYATRVLASEVRRRGGRVEAFDHGGVTGLTQLVGSTALIELCTSSRFHLATPEWAELLAKTDAISIAAPLNSVTLAGGGGEPTFRQAFRDGTERKGTRPRVIVIGHPHKGLRQFPIAAISDATYWDFQIELVGQLKRMDVDFFCKPHPEGEFRGRRNPLEELAPTSYSRFEEHLDDADVFLFDAPTSTTFLESLCTRRRVVLIDRLYGFNPVVEPHIRERCRIVKGHFDARNRFRVDFSELEEAICGTGSEPDPSYFRRLTSG